MKKKFISILIVTILILNTLLCSAVNISFEDLDNTNFITEDNSFNDDTPFEVTLNNEENKNIQSINLLNTNNLNLQQSYINDNILNNLSYTTIDLTNLSTGEVITHDCNLYLVSNFDETNHWQECSICGKVIGLESHTYVDNGWTGGSVNNCASNNVHLFSCKCGISCSNTIGRKEHIFGKYSNNTVLFSYGRACLVCNAGDYKTMHYCIKSDGSKINCGNPGKCALCGYNYSVVHTATVNYNNPNNYSDKIYCDACSKYMGNVLSNNYINDTSNNSICNSLISINGNYNNFSYTIHNPNPNIKNVSTIRNGLELTSTVRYIQHVEYKTNLVHVYYYFQNGEKHCINFYIRDICPDLNAPIITNIITNNTENWTLDSNIIIQGTENYCNSVYLTLKDTNDNVYLENVSTIVNNGNWNYTLSPNIEMKENIEFILIVKDTLDNKTTQSFYLSKIDNKPPVNIGDKETATEWSKTKDYVVTTTDYGIGQVSTSVNNTENYELATEEDNIFYKGYTFIGDVYGSLPVSIHSKDGLGNTSTEFVKVYNLDNTPPTIEEILLDKTLHSTNITIQTNDKNTKLNKEGSGITGYAITTENTEPIDYQENNTFTITEPNTYYLWVKDLVGNVTSKEIYLPIQYKVTINPDGGTWKWSTEPQEIITSSNEPYDLNPQPTKEGYTFTEWKVTGEGYITDDGELIITGSDVEVIPIWETNQYSVTYIDYDVTNNKNLNQINKQVDYNTTIRGFDLGNDISDNAYYNQYRLVSDTESKVTTSNNTVYRYFEFCYTEKSSHLDFNDNDNIDNLRPETYTLQLQLEDGTLIDEVTLSSDVTDYTFTQLLKYDKDGKEYKYQIVPVISDRYKVTPNPETGEPEINYLSPEYSILIPKVTTLDGKTGDLSYTLKVNSVLFYDDKIIITPDSSFTLTDGISTLLANIVQNQTIFTKKDITNNQLTVTGDIQVNKKYFAGTWIGVFNFNIKYKVKN